MALEKPIVQRILTVRDHIREALKAELVGPLPGLPAMQTGIGEGHKGEEILPPQDPPRLRYGAGILFPQQTVVEEQEDVESEIELNDVSLSIEDLPETIDGETVLAPAPRSEADTEQEVNRANEYLPSATGLTTLIHVPNTGIKVTVRAARYEKREIPDRGYTDNKGEYHPYYAWWRMPIVEEIHIPQKRLLDIHATPSEYVVNTGSNTHKLALHILSRPFSDDQRLVTITLLNRTESAGLRPADDECFFQCGFTVEATDGSDCFLAYPERQVGRDTPDEASLRLLYRNRRAFAVGHGCAPEWSHSGMDQNGGMTSNQIEDRGVASDLSSRATRVWTESIPVFEIKPVLPREIPGLELTMRTLADPDSEEPILLCRRLAEEYRSWILQQRERINYENIPDERMRNTAHDHMKKCDECLDRIEAGIELLESDRRVRKAFAMTNRAMLMQRLHYRISTKVRNWIRENGELKPESPLIPPDYATAQDKWYPFQLAFLLMNLKSLGVPESVERSLVDVIWFPTGGGKTEAYLGLTACAIFLRRLRNPYNSGTTVLMRYTLRLLTAQQYNRAASLICACEYIRREDPENLGEIPITIGLWVGGTLTPNKEEAAVSELDRLLREGGSSPFVVQACPWCGAGMGPVKVGRAYQAPGYKRFANPKRVRFVCADENCDFHDDRGLPLMVIDEQMYNEPPSVLIGTVDKFALLPWYPESVSLFGIGTNSPTSPPDLIIQDELHLISGPLGSMVGLYETLIDTLSRNADGIPAKIIASTATISRAQEQVQALYGREAFLFPPQALEAGNSFFAQERVDRPGRMYLGVFATGLPSQQTAMVRVLSALLQAPASVQDNDARVVDPFWTLMVYFNSIRELGSAATLVSADIREYMGVMRRRLGLSAAWGDDSASRRRFLHPRGALELTGRVSGHVVTEALQQLFIPYTGKQTGGSGIGTAVRESRTGRKDPPVDVCLATNMIQVGLDVPRLGLMVVAGQPKMTSEYIQATSRVGRETPGLVVTLYSPAKPRDRSHYEHFRAYHESIYRFVEPTSVTPFAVPVRERALHAIIIALVRTWGGNILREHPAAGPSTQLSDHIRDILLARVGIVDKDEKVETEKMIQELVDEWRRLPPSRYGDFRPPEASTVPLMFPSSTQPLPQWDDRAYSTPSSLRNADMECDARVVTDFPHN